MKQLADLLVEASTPLREYLDVPLEDIEGVRVRSLTELERSKNANFVLDAEGNFDPQRGELQTAHLMWLSLVDVNGDQCYAMEQIPNLANLPESVSTPILSAIAELRNGHAKKNSKTTSSG